MELDRYVDGLRSQLLVAAEAGGDDARTLAGRLIAPLDSSVRLMLLEALSDAANEITLELAPGSVEIRMRGRDPELVVTPAPTESSTIEVVADDVIATSVDPDHDEGGTSRITLRLPESLKPRIEDAAARQSISVNAWLVRAVTAAVDQRGKPVTNSGPPSVGSQFTGWVR